MRGNTAPYAAVGGYPLPLGFNGRLAWIYRWFSGRPLNGHRYTDATGFRYGTMALDVSGHATTFQMLPGALRFLYVRLPAMLAIPYVIMCLVHPRESALMTVGLATLAGWRADAWRRRRRFRREVIEPVARAVAAVTNTRLAKGQGHGIVDVPANFRDDPEAKIRIMLPVQWTPEDGHRAQLVRAVASRLAMDELTPAWTLHGSRPCVSLSMPPAPPDMVAWLDAVADADSMDEGALMVGYGARGKIEIFSLLLESPHMLINGGSGAGKSVFLAWMIAQFMRRGYGVLVLDAKFVSHMWLRRVPGVHYAAEAEELHDALIWLDQELLERARRVSSAADPDAASAALVPLVAVLEELNSATNRLRAYWKSIKGPEDPALSPAITALANLANMGREMRVHILMAGQSLTAKSTGGPEGRESFGARALARATANAWRMLAPQIKPAPVKRDRPGRWHLVVGDVVKAFQVPFVDLKSEHDPDAVAKLIDWATSGLPVPDVSTMIMAGGGGTEAVDTSRSEVVTPAGISLRQYADEVGMELKTITRWRERRSDFPVEVGMGANRTKLYDRDHLREYVRSRLREPVSLED